ncbi:hypothetical protein ACJJH9_04135 [Microbulbifer sp. DLAB2-AF]|jgi:hypothetical protein|uniref:hypothetical protein n=1 Tax=Microbulbifer sp. DLAB2-AF TaxID=3243395 RepID=UPI00403A02ED
MVEYKPSKPEVVAKAVIYCVLATGFVFGLMIPFVFLGGAGGSSSAHIRGDWMFSLLDSPYFYVALSICWLIGIYSAIKGVPKWVAFSMKMLVAIAILPITLRILIQDGTWLFSKSGDNDHT